MKNYLRKLRQNSMLGRKMRFKLTCTVIALLGLTVIATFAFLSDPLAGGILTAGLGLMPFIDTKDMSEDDKKKWEAIDKAMGDACKKFLNEEIDIKAFKQTLIEDLKGMDEFKQKDISDLIDKKSFNDKIKDIEDELLVLKALTEKGKDGKVKFKSIEDQIADQMKEFIVDNNGKKSIDINLFKQKGNGISLTLAVKADPNVVTTSGGSPVSGGITIDNNILASPVQKTTIRSLANVAPISTTSVVYAELKDVSGDAEWVPEGGLKPSMTAKLKTETATVGKVALITKVTKEVISDIPQLVAELRTELFNKVDQREEDGLLNGTGDDGDIKGIADKLPGFALTGLSVTAPNMYDAIVAAYTQIVSVSGMNYAPNGIRMNPVDYANMQLTKNTNGDYIRPFKVGDELITGLRVVQTSGQDTGTFIMGDWNYLNVRDYELFNISFGWENQDFTKNQITIIGEKRLLVYLKSNHAIAFVSDTFKNVITAITEA